MSGELSQVLDTATVAGLASARSYERGLAYLEAGRVGPLRASAGRVDATVQGSEAYSVELRAEGEELRFSCSCPIGHEGAFCKHCVAVALAWLGEPGDPTPTLDDARSHLESLPQSELVELLIDHAHEDEALARQLLLRVARPASGTAADVASLRALVERAFAFRDFVPYREVWGYVRGIEEAIDLLEALLEEGRGGDVVELAEHALKVAERALEHIDNSDGQMADVIARLEDLHLEACRRARPDPVALAERLFAWELDGAWDVFDQAVSRYAEVLGDAGLARYRELAEEAWAKVPRLAPGEDSHERCGARFRITRIMQSLAQCSGTLAEQIAVAERDLSIGYRFLQIAELCREHGEDDAALEWAERGMAAFSENPDPRLRAFLVEEYRRRGRSAEALEHSLQAFGARPALESYRELATDTKALGQWDERRRWALSLLRHPEPDPPGAMRHPSLRGRGCSELVRVLLWEGDPGAAWEAAQEGGCSRDLWLKLADLRRAEHPEDALGVYHRHVEDVIAGKDKRAYSEAVRLIDETMRALYAESGWPEDFDVYVEEVRTNHKAKRNLMKLMAGLKPVELTCD
jgi:uncharacterized Zn finger protein